MSFEGYYQLICKNGHYLTEDVYCTESCECPICHDEIIWKNLVDITNGSFDKNGNRIDGHKEIKEVGRRTCCHCNSVLEIKYKIPSDEGDLKND